jgi:hypothetical protein
MEKKEGEAPPAANESGKTPERPPSESTPPAENTGNYKTLSIGQWKITGEMQLRVVKFISSNKEYIMVCGVMLIALLWYMMRKKRGKSGQSSLQTRLGIDPTDTGDYLLDWD